MKNKIIKKLAIVTILIFLIFKIVCSNIKFDSIKNDDFLFLKFLINDRESSIDKLNQKNTYKFDVDYKNMNFKSINLLDSADKTTFVYEKIAPGSSGEFEIELNSNKDLKYRIEFKSNNAKPQNLNFKVFENNTFLAEANTLEKLSESMQGDINKNQKIIYKIEWYWKFQNNQSLEKVDIQDTKDAKNINQYNFDVYTYGIAML
mgnify:CR=1 FL=1